MSGVNITTGAIGHSPRVMQFCRTELFAIEDNDWRQITGKNKAKVWNNSCFSIISKI